MTDQTITITAVTPANPKVDVSEVTRQDGTVAERQRMAIGDNTNPSAFASVDSAGNLNITGSALQSLLVVNRHMLLELRKLNLALAALSLDDIFLDEHQFDDIGVGRDQST